MIDRQPSLNLPPYQLQLRNTGNVIEVWDRWRKKYIVLTPEEFVRQHFVNWLANDLKYPESLIANEIGIEFNGMRRRCDTVVYNGRGEPLIIVEYKAPMVKITQEVFDQIFRYNSVLKVRYLVVSNGMQHYCCEMDYNTDTYRFLDNIPPYSE